MRPGLAKIIDTIHISRNFEILERELCIPENACCIDHIVTWSSKQVYELIKIQSAHYGTADYGFEDGLQLYTAVT
jgi:hypothetical protein